MGLSSILRGAGRVGSSVGRAVQAASQKLDQAVAGTVPNTPIAPPMVPPAQSAALPQAGPTAPSGAPAEGAPAAPAQKPRGFALPDLGKAPDQNGPEFQGPGGAEKYASAAAEYEHKMDIHEAYAELDRIYTEAHPGRDFQGEYEEQRRSLSEHEKSRPKGNALARGALALGDFNPAVQQSGHSNLADYDKSVDDARSQSGKSFSQRAMLKAKMHESAAADAEAKGNWKKALREHETLALLKADEAGLEHKRSMEKEGVKQEGATARAKIRREALENSTRMRTNVIAQTHGLSGSFLQTFEKEAAKQVARLLGPRDLTKDYDPADLESITSMLENLAEMIHDQQFGDGSADKYLRTSPKKRGQAKPATPAAKEQF